MESNISLIYSTIICECLWITNLKDKMSFSGHFGIWFSSNSSFQKNATSLWGREFDPRMIDKASAIPNFTARQTYLLSKCIMILMQRTKYSFLSVLMKSMGNLEIYSKLQVGNWKIYYCVNFFSVFLLTPLFIWSNYWRAMLHA